MQRGLPLEEEAVRQEKVRHLFPVKTKPHLILHKKDKGCIPPEPPGCPATYFACPIEFVSCCPINAFCGFEDGVPACFT
jgi:hypothetical protein